MQMKYLIEQLAKEKWPDKLGIICSTIIIASSFFGTRNDFLASFLFGGSLLLFSFGMSVNYYGFRFALNP